LCLFPFVAGLPGIAESQSIPDFSELKSGFARRLKKILTTGTLPYIDIESSCNSSIVNIDAIAQSMDRLNIGLMALSADIDRDQYSKGMRFDNLSERLVTRYPDRFIPVGNGGQPPALTEAPIEFLDAQEKAADNKAIMLLGEFEFRHYPSSRQIRRSQPDRDVRIPIDGPTGHRLFSLSEQMGLAFQIHYELEDELFRPLEKMLAQYPKAKVIWCHLAQIRYIERASRYTPAYLDELIRRFPNLYFDTAFGDANSIYPLSKQRHNRIWASPGSIKSEWRELIIAHPRRFLSALDLGQDRINQITEYDNNHRIFLKQLPAETQHQVAYRNTWLLLFNEEFT